MRKSLSGTSALIPQGNVHFADCDIYSQNADDAVLFYVRKQRSIPFNWSVKLLKYKHQIKTRAQKVYFIIHCHDLNLYNHNPPLTNITDMALSPRHHHPHHHRQCPHENISFHIVSSMKPTRIEEMKERWHMNMYHWNLLGPNQVYIHHTQEKYNTQFMVTYQPGSTRITQQRFLWHRNKYYNYCHKLHKYQKTQKYSFFSLKIFSFSILVSLLTNYSHINNNVSLLVI